MLRTHTCGELRINNTSLDVTLCGWVQKSREMGGLTFIDLRDRYGITQLVFNMEKNPSLCGEARKLGREYVIKAKGKVAERSNKNPKMPTGDIEILVEELIVLNTSKIPPFTIEDNTDGGEELRMKYRYLDLRRTVEDECCGCGGRRSAPPEGQCGSHTFSLLDAAALGIRVERENECESKFRQIAA